MRQQWAQRERDALDKLAALRSAKEEERTAQTVRLQKEIRHREELLDANFKLNRRNKDLAWSETTTRAECVTNAAAWATQCLDKDKELALLQRNNKIYLRQWTLTKIALSQARRLQGKVRMLVKLWVMRFRTRKLLKDVVTSIDRAVTKLDSMGDIHALEVRAGQNQSEIKTWTNCSKKIVRGWGKHELDIMPLIDHLGDHEFILEIAIEAYVTRFSNVKRTLETFVAFESDFAGQLADKQAEIDRLKCRLYRAVHADRSPVQVSPLSRRHNIASRTRCNVAGVRKKAPLMDRHTDPLPTEPSPLSSDPTLLRSIRKKPSMPNPP